MELVVAQPTGVVEVDEGTLARGDDGALEIRLRSRHVGVTSTAKDVTAVERRLRLDGDLLHVSLAMAAVGHGLSAHLASVLRRAPSRPPAP